MTYLDLLIRIKQNSQPSIVEFQYNENRRLYFMWDGNTYRRAVLTDGATMRDHLTEKEMCEKDCIRALKYEEDDNDIPGFTDSN